jgi:hypothetical protein
MLPASYKIMPTTINITCTYEIIFFFWKRFMMAQQNPAQADIAPKVPRMAKYFIGVPSK